MTSLGEVMFTGNLRIARGTTTMFGVANPSFLASPVFAPPGFTNIEAQAWVKEHHIPMLVLDGGVYYVLVHEKAPHVISLEPFYHVTDQDEALARALPSWGARASRSRTGSRGTNGKGFRP